MLFIFSHIIKSGPKSPKQWDPLENFLVVFTLCSIREKFSSKPCLFKPLSRPLSLAEETLKESLARLACLYILVSRATGSSWEVRPWFEEEVASETFDWLSYLRKIFINLTLVFYPKYHLYKPPFPFLFHFTSHFRFVFEKNSVRKIT